MSRHYYIERRRLGNDTSLSWDIAHHMATRQFPGITMVVSDRPVILLAALRKQWKKVIRQVELERASTLNTGKIRALSHTLEHMQTLQFIADIPHAAANAAAFFIAPKDLAGTSVMCHTLYIICGDQSESVLHTAGRWVHWHGVVVVYGGRESDSGSVLL